MASNTSQLSPLPAVTRHITGHNENGKAVIHSSTPAEWQSLGESQMAFNVVYTNQFAPDLNDDADIKTHETLTQSDKMGLVNPGGTVCRIVDFAPNNPAVVHRTQSLDYGVVLEGQVEMILEDSEPVIMNRGDVAVQRGYDAWVAQHQPDRMGPFTVRAAGLQEVDGCWEGNERRPGNCSWST